LSDEIEEKIRRCIVIDGDQDLEDDGDDFPESRHGREAFIEVVHSYQGVRYSYWNVESLSDVLNGMR
jgi:hypothetical protein